MHYIEKMGFLRRPLGKSSPDILIYILSKRDWSPIISQMYSSGCMVRNLYIFFCQKVRNLYMKLCCFSFSGERFDAWGIRKKNNCVNNFRESHFKRIYGCVPKTKYKRFILCKWLLDCLSLVSHSFCLLNWASLHL